MDGSRIILAAHRGDRYKCPENTMVAFEEVMNNGVDMIETDIRMTRDGELVIMHDRSALRTTGIDKNIDEMTLEEIKQLDAGCVFSEKFKGQTIPTVEEFIALVKNTNILINWELKVYPCDFGDKIAFQVAEKLLNMIEMHGLSERSMLNSFSSRVLEYIYKQYHRKFLIHGQGIHCCRKSNDNTELPESEIFDWCCLYPSPNRHRAIDCEENFIFCGKNNIFPCLCIKDNLEDYKTAINLGCKMFTSNNIYEANQILKELGVR